MSLSPLVTSRAELADRLAAVRREGKSIGLVPTMGALHEGHLSLVDASRRDCDFTVVTIFVNPTQFGPDEDFRRYPRTLEADLTLLAKRSADLIFAPPTDDIYRPGHGTRVAVGAVAEPWEGRIRPGHFDGVATIVLKLFHLVPADRAYFGQKDYQQTLVIRRMAADLDVPIEIKICPIVREADGLAMSSRNAYLSPAERVQAAALSRSLRLARQLVVEGVRDASAIQSRMASVLGEAGIDHIDYVALVDPDTLAELPEITGPTVALVAARVGTTRLIDNEILRP